MFERLVQQILSKFLSKYFTEESLAKNRINRSAQLGVWSGYVSLRNLELKKEVINAKLHSKGLPFEIIHCSFRQVEITIPWAKLSNPIGYQGRKRTDDAVVVVVMDGIHLLARTNFEFDDVALRREEVKKRRQALSDPFRKIDGEEGITYKEMLKRRFKDGLLQDIASKVHIHLRDVHIRLEDIESDPLNPCACGITLESMHVQHDDSAQVVDGLVSKIAQLNHLAVYWNTLSYERNIPAENAVLHQICRDDGEKVAQLLDSCIAKRASHVSSPSKNSYIPMHTYLLLPVDGMWHGRLSTSPKDLSSNSTAEMVVAIDPVFGQLRDYQCVQMLSFATEFRNHKFVKRYRRFRPLVPVKEDPKAWWRYATRAIRFQLRESFLRSSWTSFVDVVAFRNLYIDLFERSLKFPGDSAQERTSSELEDAILSRSKHANLALDTQMRSTTIDSDKDRTTAPDEGAGPSLPSAPSTRNSPLTTHEYLELQDIEDGLFGGLSVGTILLCRALVHSRLGRAPAAPRARAMSFLPYSVANDLDQDSEVKVELETLLEYLDKTFDVEAGAGNGNPDLIAVSIAIRFEELNLSLLSPLPATAGEHPLRQIHDKFFELSMREMQGVYLLKGDYEAKEYQLTMQDLVGTEIRDDKSHHVVLKQVEKDLDKEESFTSDRGADPTRDPLMSMSYAQCAKNSTGTDVKFVGGLNAVELSMVPECEWIFKLKAVKDRITKIPTVADYWNNLSFAYLNSLALGRLGLVAKAESAGNDHKNIDLDIRARCPILRIGDGKSGSLIVDLGTAQLKTVRLAAKPAIDATSNLNSEERAAGASSVDGELPLMDEDGRSWASKHRHEDLRITSRRSGNREYGSSTFSVDSRAQTAFVSRSMAGSAFFDEPSVREHAVDDEGRVDARTLNSLFYDVFSVQLKTGKITMCGDSDAFNLCGGFEVNTVLKKSVLPADHTLCRFRAHTVVRNLRVDLRRRVILDAAEAFSTWKTLLASSQKLQDIKVQGRSATGSRPVGGPTVRSDVNRVSYPSSPEYDSIGEASASQIDENEFFDTYENDGSLNGDNSAAWFDENWISDAESYIDSDSRSGRHDRRSRRRRGGSVSDMSSVSDQSAKEATARERKGQPGNAYLSAENLARLEEGASEDESLVENIADMDDASFHSVMSEQGQQQVLRDLGENIDDASRVVDDLRTKMRQLNRQVEEGTQEERATMRKERRSIKLTLGRAQAELRGLMALHADMAFLLSDHTVHNIQSRKQDSDVVSKRSEHAKNAKAFLAARRRRNLMLGSNGSHILTESLNREIFQGSWLFQHFQVTFHLSPDTETEQGSHKSPTFDFVASQTGLAIFHQVQDTKVYFSSDQVSAVFCDKTDVSLRSTVLFSGGNTDTFLPSHFPHLISRSMEDKFFRGSLHFDKRGSFEKANRKTRVLKARVVIGDMEIFPSKQTIKSLRHFFALAGQTTIAPCSEAEESPLSVDEATSHVSTSALQNETNCSREASSMGLDVVFRLSSLRLIMGNSLKISGAVAVTETAIRLLRVGASSQQKIQIDMRCTNFQVLQILSHEAGHGAEILGRKDPYNALVQVRMRSQVTPFSNHSGWVVGVRDRDPSDNEIYVRNVHVGVKVNPVLFVATPAAILEFRHSVRELKSNLTQMKAKNGSGGEKTLLAQLSKVYPLRWRLDLSLKRLFVNFPERAREDFTLTDEIESRLKLGLSFVCCIQESSSHIGFLSIRAGVTELAVTRPGDDWQILEPVSIFCDAFFETDWLVRSGKFSDLQLGHLKLDLTSALNEISALSHRFGWDPSLLQHDTTTQRGVVLKLTPVKGNISSQVVGLIADTTQGLKTALFNSSAAGPKVAASTIRSPMPAPKNLGIRVVLDDIEIELRREPDSRPGSQPSSLVSFKLTDVRLEFERGEQIAASILIRNSALYDLSSSRAVQVVGESLGNHERETPYFVRAKLYVDRNIDGPTTVRLEINWGSIQCLLLPAFLVSIISFKDDIQVLLTHSNQGPHGSSKSDVLERLKGCDHDVNFILTAHADAFECILSSRDIPEYIRQNATDAIGVVALRWKASLSLSLALDTLHGVSLPWLTLNLDGKFADEDDISLFRDFISRYVSGDSELSADSVEGSHQLQNVFTSRIGLAVSGFQVIRTTISGKILKASQRTVSYKSATRMCFVVTPPSIGEQRVTNPIGVVMQYRCAGATMFGLPNGQEGSRLQLDVSQLLEVRAKFVDILLYISQSSGGFTESFKTTVKPILEIFKDIDSRRKRSKAVTSASAPERKSDHQTKNSIANVLKGAPTMCLVKLEGFQITCVPGGATRLNESPILKIELNHFSAGLALFPLPMQRRGGVSRSSKNLLAATDILHATLAGWVVCDLSGHYHNSRLVAWEPFVEPWTADLRFGIDAVDFLGLQPTPSAEKAEIRSPRSSASQLETHSSSSIGDVTGDRLRDFGRLFRAPFQSSLSVKQTSSDDVCISHPDFCYLMLASLSRTTMLSVMYGSKETIEEKEARLFSRLPTREKLDWLVGFGFPGRENGEVYAASCVLADSKPLNINITGALLENVLGYLHPKSRGLQRVAPHWIRNDTGMVSRVHKSPR
jgi:Vacuolar sorting-associated protein 13, N-terminal/N-terminal region of Chorein or VPS13